ncbi:MAG: DUF4397 domain-containing protein [Planctomycetes bacterium]|nr:DUF4397 domain-containing protein [Planctomycetota bacterium]
MIRTFASTLLLALPVAAQGTAKISFLHGIPGLASPVDVYANNNKLFSFDFTESKGPIDIPAASYKFDIKLGNTTVLTASPKLDADRNYTAVAHLTSSGIALALFDNDLSSTKAGDTRLAVHHLADAPAVDVRARAAGSTGAYAKLVSNLSNPSRAIADVKAMRYEVGLSPAGQTQFAFGPATFEFLPDRYYAIFAIGKLGQSSFQLFVQEQFVEPRATPARVSVIHGIPGLPQAVDIFSNNTKLFDFTYGQVRGPLDLEPGSYKIDVKLGSTTVLSATPTLAEGMDYTAIAHLDASGKNTLSFFVNDVAATAKSGDTRVTVRHTAQAPAVDVRGRPTGNGAFAVLSGNLANAKEATLEIASGSYDIGLTPAGQTQFAFGPTTLKLDAKKLYTVYAIGVLGQNSFQLVAQAFDLRRALSTKISGRGCGGGTIAISKPQIDFDEDFTISLVGAPIHALAVLHVGASDTKLGSLMLPFDLGVVGLSGCTLYQDSLAVFGAQANGAGSASFTIDIPGSLATIDGVYFQWSFWTSAGPRLTDLLSITGN